MTQKQFSPFGECEPGEHSGQIKWTRYPVDARGKDKLGRELGMMTCTVCLNAVEIGVVKPTERNS